MPDAKGFLDAINVEWVAVSPKAFTHLLASGFERIISMKRRLTLIANRDRMGEAWVTYGVRPVESADDGERLALFADVGFGVGAIALITCAVLYMTDGDVESEQASAGLYITPAVSATEAGVSARLSF